MPRLDDGTAVDRADALAWFAARPVSARPPPDALPIGRDEASAAIVERTRRRRQRGRRSSAPATRRAGRGVHGLERSPADRGPPRAHARLPRQPARLRGSPSHERYAGRADYEAGCARPPNDLVAQRLLLPDDVDLVVADALRSYDESLTGRRNPPPVAFAGARHPPHRDSDDAVTVPRAHGHPRRAAAGVRSLDGADRDLRRARLALRVRSRRHAGLRAPRGVPTGR